MNIHEYQAKQILVQHGINVPDGAIAYTPAEAKRVAQQISSRGPWMLKAQIQAGARNDGYFLGHSAGQKGGVRKITQISNISYEAAQMLNNTLVTEQTGTQGRLVSKVYVETFKSVKRFFYVGMVINSVVPAVTILVSDVINQDMLKVPSEFLERILHIDLAYGETITDKQIVKILDFLSLDKKHLDSFSDFFSKLHRTFLELDAQMIEINPAGVMKNREIIALDAKINFDDNALFRHPEIARMQDDYEEDPRVLRALRYGFQYQEYEGNVGCIVNGDDLALECMDIVKSKGLSTACSLNIRGGVDKDSIAEGIKIIMTNPRVEGILINILGGFLRCNLIADGILAATQEVGLNMPLIVRLEGTNKEEAQTILRQSNLPIVFADDTDDAVKKLQISMEEND